MARSGSQHGPARPWPGGAGGWSRRSARPARPIGCGTQTGVYAQYTELRFKENKQEYTALAEKVEQELATRIASDLAEKISQSLPSEYRDLLVPLLMRPIPKVDISTGATPPVRPAMPGAATAHDVTTKQETFKSTTTEAHQGSSAASEKKIVLQAEKLITEALTALAKEPPPRCHCSTR